MKRLFFISAILFVGLNIHSQTPYWQWAKAGIGHNLTTSEGYSIANDVNGASYIAGNFHDTLTFDTTILLPQNSSNANSYLVKYNSFGSVVWAKSFGGFGGRVKTDISGNVYLAGGFNNAAGTVSIGSYILTSAGDHDIFIAKFDSSGNLQWVKTAGGTKAETVNDIECDMFGNIYVTGSFYSPIISFGSSSLTNSSSAGNISNVFIAKYNPSGNIIWTKGALENASDYLLGITTDNIGNVLITGYFESTTINFGITTLSLIGTGNSFIVNLDSSCNEIWAISIGSSSFVRVGEDIITNSSRDIYVVGATTIVSNQNCNAILMKYDSFGNLQWIKSSLTNNSSYGSSIALDACENVFISGLMDNANHISFATFNLPPIDTIYNDNMFLAKFDSNGTVLWAEVLGGGGDDMNSISSDLVGNIYVTGDFIPMQFIIGNDTLINTCNESPFIAKLYFPCFIGQQIPETQNSNTEIIISPNPFTYQTTITFNEAQKNTTIKITDIFGKEIKTIKFTGRQLIIEKAEMEAGIYFVQTTDEQKHICNKKIIIQ